MFCIICFTSIHRLGRAVLSDQKVTSFVVTVVWCIQYDVLRSSVGVLLTDHVTNSMEQIPYCGANFRSTVQEISCFVWDRKVNYCQQNPAAVTFAIWIRSRVSHHIFFFFRMCFNPYPTAFPYGNGMVLHFYQQQESSTTKTVHKVINTGLKTYV